jgi:16S rRNA processing protein RimM
LSKSSAAGAGANRPVVLAAVAGAHGIHGEVRLKLFAENIESLARHRSVQVGGRTLTLEAVKPGKTPVARLAEITDRTAAEALRGSLLTVARCALPPLGEGEYYHADLIGLPCANAAGEVVGIVVAVENFGAGDILEIDRRDGATAMVPFKAGIADWDGDRIVIDPQFLA